MGPGKFVRSIEGAATLVGDSLQVKKDIPNVTPLCGGNGDLMVDWLTLRFLIWCPEPINGGNVISISKDGELEYKTDKFLQVKGSFDTNTNVRTQPLKDEMTAHILGDDFKELTITGNPVKYFQGHNIFGSTDIHSLAVAWFLSISKKLDLPEQPELVLNNLKNGLISITRIDLNAQIELKSRTSVIDYLSMLLKNARSRHGTAVSSGETVYFGKNSERWSFKFYSKGLEIEKHELPRELQSTKLPEYANNKLRGELTLRSKELSKLKLNVINSWRELELIDVFSGYMGKIEMSSQIDLDDLVLELPAHLRSSYLLWDTGHNLKTILPKPTFYRHRKGLKEFGVDISLVRDVEPKEKRKPKAEFVHPKDLVPCGVPDWAIGTDLYYEPPPVHVSIEQLRNGR